MSEIRYVGAPRPKHRWDGYRRIAAWAGLLEIFSVVIVIVSLGHNFTTGRQEPGAVLATIVILGAPAVLAGLVSGSRYYALYAGFAQRLEPTAELSAADSASGNVAGSSFIGDSLWGSLIAGLAGSIPATIAISSVFSPFAVIFLPLFVLIIGISWFAGWVVGGVSSMLLSAAIGIVVGSGRRRTRGGRLLWIVTAALLVVVPVAIAVPIVGSSLADGRTNPFGAIAATAGFPIDGFEFSLGDPMLWVARVAIWTGVLLFAVLVVAGTPALLERRGVTGSSDGPLS